MLFSAAKKSDYFYIDAQKRLIKIDLGVVDDSFFYKNVNISFQYFSNSKYLLFKPFFTIFKFTYLYIVVISCNEILTDTFEDFWLSSNQPRNL